MRSVIQWAFDLIRFHLTGLLLVTFLIHISRDFESLSWLLPFSFPSYIKNPLSPPLKRNDYLPFSAFWEIIPKILFYRVPDGLFPWVENFSPRMSGKGINDPYRFWDNRRDVGIIVIYWMIESHICNCTLLRSSYSQKTFTRYFERDY